jgi:hypothetical protein
MQPELDAPLCLCIELDADFFYLIRSYADRSGLRAEMLQRGKDAVEQVWIQQPAVLIFAIDHPGRDVAFTILDELKTDSKTLSIPVVVFSWMDDEESALERGADSFVRKPVMYADFLEALTSLGICVSH